MIKPVTEKYRPVSITHSCFLDERAQSTEPAHYAVVAECALVAKQRQSQNARIKIKKRCGFISTLLQSADSS